MRVVGRAFGMSSVVCVGYSEDDADVCFFGQVSLHRTSCRSSSSQLFIVRAGAPPHRIRLHSHFLELYLTSVSLSLSRGLHSSIDHTQLLTHLWTPPFTTNTCPPRTTLVVHKSLSFRISSTATNVWRTFRLHWQISWKLWIFSTLKDTISSDS